jgi:hypothetical protein
MGVWPVAADPGPLEQAIINVALNARDAMPGGGQLIIETANIDTANPSATGSGPSWANSDDLAELLPDQYGGIRVRDTGPGMDAATSAGGVTGQPDQPATAARSGPQKGRGTRPSAGAVIRFVA